MTSRRAAPILAALAGTVLLSVLCFRFVTLRSDMADFLPAGSSPAAQLMQDELRSGPGTSLILIGIENAPAPELARISQALAGSLLRSGDFALVENGEEALGDADERFLFGHRYLLSPVTIPAAFMAPALRADFQRLLTGLASSASPLVARFGLADPPGAFLEVMGRWGGESPVRSVAGVWFAPHQDRALILCRTRATGLDLAGQDAAGAAIAAGFAAARPGQARLLVSGPAVFAREAAAGIRADVRLLSVASALLVAGLLIWRFRSPLVIAAIAVPVLLGTSIAALIVQAAFGFVHGIAFAFGMVMLGVTVDYPVLLIGHRKRAEAAWGTIRRIGPAFNLAVTTAALGLTGMIFSGVTGIAQLGLFSVAGVVVVAAATRFLLPPLIVAADLAPVAAGDPAWLARVEHWREWRVWGLVPVGAAALYLVAIGGPRFETDLANLSPVPQSARDLDAALRAEIGAPDVGQLLVLRAPTAEAVLAKEETVMPILGGLQAEKVIGGAEIAARFLPSEATQRMRRAALPDQAALGQAIAAAQAGMPFRPDAFDRFAGDVAATRAMPPVAPGDATSPLFAARIAPLLFPRGNEWVGLVVPRGLADPRRFAAAFAGMPGLTYLVIRTESNAIVARATARAIRWLAIGAAAAIVILAVFLRDPWRTARVVGAIAAAGLVTLACLTAAGARLSLIHIVSLQFVAGVGLDYALFFARRQLDAEERARTLRTLVTCNAMTLLTFGLLALCRTPLLREMGSTVALGAIAAMIFGFLFAGQHPRHDGTTA